MYIEFFGLPGSGKSTLARQLRERSLAYVSARDASVAHVFFFIFRHPLIAGYWLKQAVIESFLIRRPGLVRFKFSLLLHTFAQVRYAQGSKDKIILDEGFLQRALSIFETKKTHIEFMRMLHFIINADVYIEVIGEEPFFARYRRSDSNRGKFGQAYLTNWEEVVRHNYQVLLQALKDRGVQYRMYNRARGTVEEIDKYITRHENALERTSV